MRLNNERIIMITLRKLQLKDVPLMLEWMHDEEAKHIFQNNFAEIDDVAAKKFVENSFKRSTTFCNC